MITTILAQLHYSQKHIVKDMVRTGVINSRPALVPNLSLNGIAGTVQGEVASSSRGVLLIMDSSKWNWEYSTIGN